MFLEQVNDTLFGTISPKKDDNNYNKENEDKLFSSMLNNINKQNEDEEMEKMLEEIRLMLSVGPLQYKIIKLKEKKEALLQRLTKEDLSDEERESIKKEIEGIDKEIEEAMRMHRDLQKIEKEKKAKLQKKELKENTTYEEDRKKIFSKIERLKGEISMLINKGVLHKGHNEVDKSVLQYKLAQKELESKKL